MPRTTPVSSILNLVEARLAEGPVDAGALLDALGRAALLPALIIPALLIVSPLSAVPLFSSFCGLIIAVVAVQGALGRLQPWLPSFLLNRRLPTERTLAAIKVLRRLTGWLDRVTRRRLSVLVRRPLNRVLYLICALAAVCIPFFELVPMLSTTVGAGVLLIAVGILTRDGVFALLGLGVLGFASLLPWFVVTQVTAIVA